MDELIVDVRTREEFAKEHVKGAINIPLHDLDFYIDFLKDKKIRMLWKQMMWKNTRRKKEE